MPYDTFLSYSLADQLRATKVRDHLVGAGLHVWMYQDQTGLGSPLRDAISSGLQEARTITPILTSCALESPAVYNEVKFGIENGKKVIPVVLNPKQFNESEKWRSLLAEVNWGPLNDGALSRRLTAEVLADIETAIRRPDDRRCPIICVYHFKGGVGKTTVSAHLASHLYHSAKPAVSVLLIDCDAQSNLSSVFLTRQKLAQNSLQSHNLIGMLEPNRLVAEHDLFSPYEIAPGSLSDHAAHRVQTQLHRNENEGKSFSIVANSIKATKYGTVSPAQLAQLSGNFQNAIQKLSLQYDFIILDCNPSTTLLSHCALESATDILVPIRADKYTSDGLENMDELLSHFFKLEFARGLKPETKQLWTLINFSDLAHIRETNEQRSRGSGAEADLLKDILQPLKSGTSLGQFKLSLLDSRIPDSGFLRSKPIETERLDPENPPSRNLLRFFNDARAKRTAEAFDKLAKEVREKTRGRSKVVYV